MSNRLQGKWALVSGASSGFGAETARQMADMGVNLLLGARRENRLGQVAAECLKRGAASAHVHKLDVADTASVNAFADWAKTTAGRVDVLINNAAIGSYTPFLEMTVKEWDLVMSIDLRAPFIACKAVAPIMIEQGGGSIINISSHAANNIFSSTLTADSEEIALIGQNYGTAKVGLERLTWGLALELGPYNIAVNVLKPLRPVITEGFLAQRPDADVSTWATPSDMVKAAKYLASQDAKGLTGATVTAEELVRRLGL